MLIACARYFQVTCLIKENLIKHTRGISKLDTQHHAIILHIRTRLIYVNFKNLESLTGVIWEQEKRTLINTFASELQQLNERISDKVNKFPQNYKF